MDTGIGVLHGEKLVNQRPDLILLHPSVSLYGALACHHINGLVTYTGPLTNGLHPPVQYFVKVIKTKTISQDIGNASYDNSLRTEGFYFKARSSKSAIMKRKSYSAGESSTTYGSRTI